MTKAEVVALLMERTGLARKDAIRAVETFLDCVKTGLKNGDKVSLVGFGTFYVKTKNARRGRNPRTGEQISIPEKRVAVFKPGKSFRDSANPEEADAPSSGSEPPTA